jgi:hypothetical protein
MCRFSTRAVQPFMAVGAQGDQVQIVIRSLLTQQSLVLDLQVLPGTADLTLPAISLHYLLPKLAVQLGIKSQAGLFRGDAVQEAFSVTSCRKACRCSPGRNLKKRDIDCRSTVGSSLSSCAPARKSAQIISRPRCRKRPNSLRKCSLDSVGLANLFTIERLSVPDAAS